MNKIDISPQQILSFDADPRLTHDVLNQVTMENDWTMNNLNPNNNYTTDTFLQDRDEYIDLINWFDECLEEVKMYKQFMFDGKFSITQCWANRTNTGGSHHVHSHPNSLLSGVFYLTNSHPTVFHGPLGWRLSLIESRANEPSITEVQSIAGRLLIFPSYMPHGTNHMEDKEDRYSISFNTFIQGKLGHPNNLNYIPINS